MGLDSADVLKIADLAQLAVTDEEAAGLVTDLSNILDLVAQMSAVDTAGVEPLAHPLEMGQRLRPDEVREPNRREDFQAIAPLTEQGLYLVPRVIE
jgi:aspartyl-tRNA(Asn)/glutamyl-tRNA(Gln) amidotransferase subunit C